MGCQFSSIGKMVARSVGKHSVPVNAVRRPRRRFPRNSTTPAQRVLALSPYATNMGRSLLLAYQPDGPLRDGVADPAREPHCSCRSARPVDRQGAHAMPELENAFIYVVARIVLTQQQR
jgi:hypothetical protein